MKKLTIFLLMVSMFLGLQTVSAESYQRWIYWTNQSSHQITPHEMADITKALYEGRIKANVEYRLTESGVTYKIPQPFLYLQYLILAVKSARPSACTAKEIVDAIYYSQKIGWGTDVSIRVKNYWYSSLYNKIDVTPDYSGEGKNTDFLFIDSKPTIKCDCGNPLESPPCFVTPPPVQETYCPPALTAPTAPVESFVPYRKPVVQLESVVPVPVVLAPKRNHTLLWVGAGILATSLVYYGIHELGEKHGGGEPVTAPGHTDTGGPVGAPGHGDAVKSPYYLPVYRPITYTNTLVIRNNASMERNKWVSIHLGF